MIDLGFVGIRRLATLQDLALQSAGVVLSTLLAEPAKAP
jgi:hypothetical protein